MAEVLVDFDAALSGPGAQEYRPRVCGRLMPDGRLWEGWIEFVPLGGGPVLRTGRETEQSNRASLEGWASRLTTAYLEGALHRALRVTVNARPPDTKPAYAGPAPPPAHDPALETVEVAPGLYAVLDPFETHRKGEDVLLAELNALGVRHLRRIVEAYDLVNERVDLESLSQSALIELIMGAVRKRTR